MCYGDPSWGNDGYYQAYIDEIERQEYERRDEEEKYLRHLEEQRIQEEIDRANQEPK